MTFKQLTIFTLSASFFGMIAMAQQMQTFGGAAGGFMQGGQAGPQSQFQANAQFAGQFGGQMQGQAQGQYMGPHPGMQAYQPTMNPGMQQMAPQMVGEQQAYQTVSANNCIVERNANTVVTQQVMQQGISQPGHVIGF